MTSLATWPPPGELLGIAEREFSSPEDEGGAPEEYAEEHAADYDEEMEEQGGINLNTDLRFKPYVSVSAQLCQGSLCFPKDLRNFRFWQCLGVEILQFCVRESRNVFHHTLGLSFSWC